MAKSFSQQISVPSLAVLSADRTRGFVAAACERVNGALIRCEERYPNDGPHSVLYVVVDRDAEHYRTNLNLLHDEYFGAGKWDPLAPVRLEVVDRATDEALQRLIDAGLVSKTVRATRPLLPGESAEVAPPPLSPAELEKIATHRRRAARKLKMASVLSAAGMGEEARGPLLEGLLPLGCALALEQRLPEPSCLSEALLAPLSACWKEALPILRQFTTEGTGECKPVIQALTQYIALE